MTHKSAKKVKPAPKTFSRKKRERIKEGERYVLDADGTLKPRARERKKDKNASHTEILIHAIVERTHADGGFWASSVAREGVKQIPQKVHLLSQPFHERRGVALRSGFEVLAKLVSLPPEGRAKASDVVKAKILKIIAKPSQTFLAHVSLNDNGTARLNSANKRFMEMSMLLDPVEVQKLNLKQGDLLEMQESNSRHAGSKFMPVKKAGNVNTEYGLSQISLQELELPFEFPAEVEAEVAKIQEVDFKGREDWRNIPLCTIDPIDAKDHDDAVAAQWDESPANQGGFIIFVAIADVAAYVRPNTALDSHAKLRGNSIYFPGRVVPMLPEKLSNDLCSLIELTDRPALAMRIVFDSTGHKKSQSIHRIIMRSHAKLAYEHAQAIFDNIDSPPLAGGVGGGVFLSDTKESNSKKKIPPSVSLREPAPPPILRPKASEGAAISGSGSPTINTKIISALTTLYKCYQILAKARDKRAPLELDLPERKIKLNSEGRVEQVIFPERLDAHKLIEECMIHANVAAAEILEQFKSPLIYRAHDAPTNEKMLTLKTVLKSLNISLPAGNDLRPTNFNRILKDVKNKPHEHMVNEIILRSQAQAEYVAENYGHFGLNLHKYAHFTSPIRRYADTIVHRALIRAAKLGDDGLTNNEIEELVEIAKHISGTERKAVTAERDTSDRLIAHFLSGSVGAVFNARISGLTRSGIFVRLNDTGADGYIPKAAMGFGFQFDEKLVIWRGRKNNQKYEMGQAIEVRLSEAVPMAGALRFEFADSPALLKSEKKNVGAPKYKGKRR